MRYCMVIDLDKCIGCQTCAVICKMHHAQPQGTWWNRVFTQGSDYHQSAVGTKDGFKIEVIRPLDPSPLSAAEALEFTIDGANIGVYKYDVNVKKQRERLNNIKKNNTVYFVGFPYPVYEVSGSFIVVGLDKHKQKKRILKSLRDFK